MMGTYMHVAAAALRVVSAVEVNISMHNPRPRHSSRDTAGISVYQTGEKSTCIRRAGFPFVPFHRERVQKASFWLKMGEKGTRRKPRAAHFRWLARLFARQECRDPCSDSRSSEREILTHHSTCKLRATTPPECRPSA